MGRTAGPPRDCTEGSPARPRARAGAGSAGSQRLAGGVPSAAPALCQRAAWAPASSLALPGCSAACEARAWPPAWARAPAPGRAQAPTGAPARTWVGSTEAARLTLGTGLPGVCLTWRGSYPSLALFLLCFLSLFSIFLLFFFYFTFLFSPFSLFFLFSLPVFFFFLPFFLFFSSPFFFFLLCSSSPTPSLSFLGVPPPPCQPRPQPVLGWQSLLLPAHSADLMWEAVRSLAGRAGAGRSRSAHKPVLFPALRPADGGELVFPPRIPASLPLLPLHREGSGFHPPAPPPCPGVASASIQPGSDGIRRWLHLPDPAPPPLPPPPAAPFPSHPRGGEARPGSGAADDDVDTLERVREPPCLCLRTSPRRYHCCQPLWAGTATQTPGTPPTATLPRQSWSMLGLGSPAAPK